MRLYTKKLICNEGQELIVKEGWDCLSLEGFCIYNLGETDISLKINNSEDPLILEPNEGFDSEKYPVRSCVCLTPNANVKLSGWY